MIQGKVKSKVKGKIEGDSRLRMVNYVLSFLIYVNKIQFFVTCRPHDSEHTNLAIK